MKKEELNRISNQKICQKTKANNYMYRCTNSGAFFISVKGSMKETLDQLIELQEIDCRLYEINELKGDLPEKVLDQEKSWMCIRAKMM